MDVYVSFVCVSRFKNELTLIVRYYFVILVYLLWDHPLLPNWSHGGFLQLLRPHTWLSRCSRLHPNYSQLLSLRVLHFRLNFWSCFSLGHVFT